MPRSSPPPPKPPRSSPELRDRDLALDAGSIDAALAEIVPDERDRRFVLRCVLEEGPRHDRVASWALLRMLAALLSEVGGADSSMRDATAAPLGMRLPPHVGASGEEPEFPIGIPTRMIREVLDADEAALALECLRDGPPHHVLANATMAWLLEAIYERARGGRRPSQPPPRKKDGRG